LIFLEDFDGLDMPGIREHIDDSGGFGVWGDVWGKGRLESE